MCVYPIPSDPPTNQVDFTNFANDKTSKFAIFINRGLNPQEGLSTINVIII